MGFKLQVTPKLRVPVTVGVNCCACDTCKLALPGLRDTATTGTSVTCALPDFVGSAVLIAVTVTVCGEVRDAGAVYRPLLIAPMLGFKLQVTPVFPVPVTEGVNCCVCDGSKLALPGLSDTAAGWPSST